MNQDQKLNQFAQRELMRNLKQFVLQDDDGSVIAFGQYLIQRASTGYTVQTLGGNQYNFNDQRTALTWCTKKPVNCWRWTVNVSCWRPT